MGTRRKNFYKQPPELADLSAIEDDTQLAICCDVMVRRTLSYYSGRIVVGVGKTQLINELAWMLARGGYGVDAVTSEGTIMLVSDGSPRASIKIREKQT